MGTVYVFELERAVDVRWQMVYGYRFDGHKVY